MSYITNVYDPSGNCPKRTRGISIERFFGARTTGIVVTWKEGEGANIGASFDFSLYIARPSNKIELGKVMGPGYEIDFNLPEFGGSFGSNASEFKTDPAATYYKGSLNIGPGLGISMGQTYSKVFYIPWIFGVF